MLTSNQQTVFDWINGDLELPVYAEVYKGALELLNRKSPGYITFVSHAGRDLMNGLVADVEEIIRQQAQYVQLMEEFQDDWKDEWGGERYNTTEDSDENGHLIPNAICKKVKKLVDEHREGRLRAAEIDSSFFTTFLGYAKGSIPHDSSQEWRRARRWFGNHTHLRKPEFSEKTSDELQKHFQNLDRFLYAAAASELEQLRSIHEILEEANQ